MTRKSTQIAITSCSTSLREIRVAAHVMKEHIHIVLRHLPFAVSAPRTAPLLPPHSDGGKRFLQPDIITFTQTSTRDCWVSHVNHKHLEIRLMLHSTVSPCLHDELDASVPHNKSQCRTQYLIIFLFGEGGDISQVPITGTEIKTQESHLLFVAVIKHWGSWGTGAVCCVALVWLHFAHDGRTC